MSKLTCSFHIDKPAQTRCISCMTPICSECVVLRQQQPWCPRCNYRFRRQSVLMWVIGATAVVVLLLVGWWNNSGWQKPGRKGPSIGSSVRGQDARKIRSLSAELDAEPCDRWKILELAQTLYRVGEFRLLIEYADRFLDGCGDHSELQSVLYHSRMQISDWNSALDVADQLIASNPMDTRYRSWRGLAFEKKGDLEQAASDYRQALSINPRLSDIPINLANIYEKLHRPCDAILPLEQILHYFPNIQHRRQIRQRINDLYRIGDCGGLVGEGRVVIRLIPGSDVFLGDVSINDKRPGKFVIGTASSYVTLSSEYADQIGLEPSKGSEILLQGVSGIQTGRLLTVDKVAIQSIWANRVDVVVADMSDDFVDGYLGLSFLSRFRVEMDHQKGQMVIEVRKTE